MGFPRQERWSGLPFLPPGDLPDPGIKPQSPALAGGFFTTELPGKPHIYFTIRHQNYRVPEKRPDPSSSNLIQDRYGHCHLPPTSQDPQPTKCLALGWQVFPLSRLKILLYIYYLFWAMLSLHCCTRAFSICSEQGLFTSCVHGLLIMVASPVAECGL